MRLNVPFGRTRMRDEGGAVIVIVAIFMTVAIGSAAFALDIGNAWQAEGKRHTATDAAAMAAAETYANGSTGCPTVGSDYVASNDTDATMTSCTLVPYNASSTAGYVTVKAQKTVSYSFAQIFNKSSQVVKSQATVQWGPPTGANNVRPIGLCLYDTHLSSWLNLPAGPTGPSGSITVPLDNGGAVNGCASTSNWGWLDLSGSGGGADVNSWLDNGYQAMLNVPSNIQAETGALSSVQNHLSSLKANAV